MNLATAFAIFVAKGSDPAAPGPGPSGPPTNVSSSDYGSPDKKRISWTIADASAYTRVYMEQGVCPGTPPLETTVNPGITSFDSLFLASNDPHRVQVSHYRNGQESSKTSCHQTGVEV